MNNTIKTSQLLGIIREVVRESIAERKDKWIQKAVDPSHKGYCTPMTKSTCTPRRKALAMRFKKGDLSEDTLQKLHKMRDKISEILAECDCGCNDDKHEMEEAGLTSEASYKVVSPNSVDTSKENKAREIQTDPKVNETAYKVQGPSLKTFKDSPQFPKAVNDPKNR